MFAPNGLLSFVLVAACIGGLWYFINLGNAVARVADPSYRYWASPQKWAIIGSVGAFALFIIVLILGSLVDF